MRDTTIGINAIIQQRVSESYRDGLEVGRRRMSVSVDFYISKRALVVPRDMVSEISAQTIARSTLSREPDNAIFARAAAAFRALAPDALALMLLNG